jgi:hypothetical protein
MSCPPSFFVAGQISRQCAKGISAEPAYQRPGRFGLSHKSTLQPSGRTFLAVHAVAREVAMFDGSSHYDFIVCGAGSAGCVK